MNTPDLAALSKRWLGERAATARERAVFERIAARQLVSRHPSGGEDAPASFGDRIADRVASFGGSWTFIGLFVGFLIAWTLLNAHWLTHQALDPFPYIFLNLLLSMVAALQAPVIMMSQNRQGARDRAAAEHDYEVNLKAEIEIMALHEKFEALRAEQLQAIERSQQVQLGRIAAMLEAKRPSA